MKKIISFRKICLLMSLIMVFSVISPTIASADYTAIDDIVFSSKDLANAEISRQGRDMIVIKSTSTNASNHTSLMQSFEEQSFQVKSEEVNITALLFNNEEDVDKVYRELMSVPYEQSNYRVNGDVAAGLRAHTTVYYTEEIVDGYRWRRMVRIEGGNDKKNASNIIGNGFMISKQDVSYGAQGKNLEGYNGFRAFIGGETLYNSANSFSIDVDAEHPDWPTVCADVAQCLVGCTYVVKIHSVRDDSDRELVVVNTVVGTTEGIYPWDT